MKRGIYGLKQAAKVWNEQVDDLLKLITPQWHIASEFIREQSHFIAI